MKNLAKLLYKLTEAEKYDFDEIPEDWEFIENNKSVTVCSCEELVEVEYFPYAFDKENNEVHYIGNCPKCGEFIYFCD
jgi:hypothetical protein